MAGDRITDPPDHEARWEAIYRRGDQLNLYPHDLIVSWFSARFPDQGSRGGVRVLDLGCGAGNHLWFLARAGFDAAGIDVSASAVAFARERLRREGLDAHLEVGSFASLPFGSSAFDVVLDRGGLAAVDLATAAKALSEARRVLRPGGTLLFTPFGAGTRIQGEKGRLIGHLWRRSDVEHVLSADAWRLVRWLRVEKRDELGEGDRRIEWWIEAERIRDGA